MVVAAQMRFLALALDRRMDRAVILGCCCLLVSFLPSSVEGGLSSECVSAATPVNNSLNGFFALSSRRSFRWKLTRAAGDKSSRRRAPTLEVRGTGLRRSDYVTLVSTPIRADSQHTTCSVSFSYKLSGGHMSVKQLVAGKFMEVWCETGRHPAWRTVHFRLHYTGRLRVFFNAAPLPASSSLRASLANISIQCCLDISGCIYYPSPNFHCGMAGFETLSDLNSSPEVAWERKSMEGLLQFSSDPGRHASMVSPLYWWHAARPAQCVVQFQSKAVQLTQAKGAAVDGLMVSPGRLALSVYGLDDILWMSRFSAASFRTRHRQHFFSLATSEPFKLLINASAQQSGIGITVEGFSVHCCPAHPPSGSGHFVSTSQAMPLTPELPTSGAVAETTEEERTPPSWSNLESTDAPLHVVNSTNDDTALREDEKSPADSSMQVKAILIPMGCVAFILVTVIAVFCCKKHSPATPSSNGSSASEGLRRPFQASMNNPGYEETIPVLQRVSRQNSDALAGIVSSKTTSNDVVQPHAYENNTLQVRQRIEEDLVTEIPKRNAYENTGAANNNFKIRIHRPAAYVNSHPLSQHSGETLPLGIGAPAAGTPQSCGAHSDHFYHRLDLVAASSEYLQPFIQPPCSADDLYSHLAQRDYLQINRDMVCIRERIGSGHFAQVYDGVWQVGEETRHVAVKTLKSGASGETKARFLRESAIMAQFNHQHIVRLYGVVVQGEPVMLILELMSCNLLEHLRSIRSGQCNKRHLLSICRQISSGMEYLESRSFVHRDLAARNVMLDPSKVCKIGDFGMARDISADQIYVSGNERVFPIKWTAPEAIEFIQFTSASDCWSYGITLYEIWSLGEKPYGDWTNEEAFKQVKGGYRLQSPRKCPNSIYYLMLQCWQAEQKNRPSFKEITQCLSDSDDSLLAF